MAAIVSFGTTDGFAWSAAMANVASDWNNICHDFSGQVLQATQIQSTNFHDRLTAGMTTVRFYVLWIDCPWTGTPNRNRKPRLFAGLCRPQVVILGEIASQNAFFHRTGN